MFGRFFRLYEEVKEAEDSHSGQDAPDPDAEATSVLLDAITGVDRENPSIEGDEEERQTAELLDDFGLLRPDDAGEDADVEVEAEEQEDVSEVDEGGPQEEPESEPEQETPESTDKETNFAKLREAKERWKEKATEYEGKIVELETQLTELPKAEEVEQLRSELAEYKNIVEQEHFKEDPAFKAEYEKPLLSAREDVVKWIRTGLTEDSIPSISAHINTLQETLGLADREADFMKAVESIAGEFEGEMMKLKFINAAEDYWRAGKNYNTAISEKDETAKYLSQKRRETIDRQRRTVPAVFSNAFQDWETTNKSIVDFYKAKEEFEYDKLRGEGIAKTEKLFQNFYETGEISRELADFVASGGAIGEVNRKAQGVMLDLIQANMKLIEDKNKHIEDLEKQISSIGGKKRKTSGNAYRDILDNNEPEEENGSVLLGTLKKVRS